MNPALDIRMKSRYHLSDEIFFATTSDESDVLLSAESAPGMARISRSKLALSLLGAILFLGAGAFIWWPAPRSPEGPSENGHRQQIQSDRSPSLGPAGIQGRDSDPAMRLHDGGWYVDDGAQHASLVENSVDISLLAIRNPEDPQLLEVDMWAMGASDDYKLMKEAYQCELQFLTGLEQDCSFRLRLVIHRKQGTGGKVKFVKPTSDGPMDEKCQAYSQCLANRVYLGEDAPMPSTGDELVAIHMDHRMLSFKGDVGEFKTTIASQLAELRLEYSQMQENPDIDPRTLERMEALLKFMELRSGDPS